MNVIVVIPKKYVKFVDEELGLVKTIYNNILDVVIVKNTSSKTYLSPYKIERLREMDFDKLIVMDRLRPSQYINLIKELRKNVIDRVMLILEIFAQHAGSKEALLQIELARLKYSLPLIKETIRHRKLGELHGFLGTGRYGFEKYYSMMKKKEAIVRKELERLRETGDTRRKARSEAGFPHVVIVGYTCAGKTSLFNVLTGLNKPVGPEPFTTLSPKSYKVVYKDLAFIVTDTVGFIRDLPPEIISAFYATLEEIVNAGLILNVVDSSKPVSNIIEDIETSRNILSKLNVHGKDMIIVLNKIDKLYFHKDILDEISKFLKPGENIIPVSCKHGTNVEKLLNEIYVRLRNRNNGVINHEEDICAKIWPSARQG